MTEPFEPRNQDFEGRTRESFARQSDMGRYSLTVGRVTDGSTAARRLNSRTSRT